MASASSLLSEEQFLCSICLDVFNNPVTTPCGHNYCKACITQYWDSNDLCQCPICKKLFHTRPDLNINTFISEMVDQFRRSLELKSASCTETDHKAEVQQTIQERQLKIQEIKHSVKFSKKEADREIADSVQVFTALVAVIERSQAELIEVIEKKQKTTEKQAEGFIKELEQEITELKKRCTELEQLSHTEDHLHLLQSFPSLSSPPHTKDWTKVNVHQSAYVGTVRRAVAQLEETLSVEMKKLCDAELKQIQQYAVNVTLDPDSANPYLVLSKDGKQVKDGDVLKNLPDNPKRFSPCLNVLGKQGFSGRFYYEVQVKGKTKWDLGVARTSVKRKGKITLDPKNGFWAIWMRNGNEYKAFADPDIILSLKEKPQKVGVFVDYEEGLVSFYDVEARAHIYSFTGCTFTEKLYPYFGPCFNDDGKNFAPLIISPANQRNQVNL